MPEDMQDSDNNRTGKTGQTINTDENREPLADNNAQIIPAQRSIDGIPLGSAAIEPESRAITPETPWTLQQFFDGEIDLEAELAARTASLPIMSRIKTRNLGENSGRGVATISTQDGSAQAILDVDKESHVMRFSITVGTLLTLRFALDDLGRDNRKRWLELMRREAGGLAFLWGPERWGKDYVICVRRRYFTNFYAFSTNNFEAAIRMTPEVTVELLDWLEKFWPDTQEDVDDSQDLLTW